MEELKNKILDNMNKQFDKFLSSLDTRDKLYNHIYEVVDKQNIIDTMTNIFNSDEYINKKQLMALSKSKDVLGEIYDDYSSLDNLFYDDIKDSIVYVSNMLINKQKELDR